MYVICAQQVNADVTNANATCRNRKQITGCGGEGGGNKEGEVRSDCRQVQSCPLGTMEMFWNQINVVMVAQHCECTKCHWTVQFKTVNVICILLQWKQKLKKKKAQIGLPDGPVVKNPTCNAGGMGLAP